MSVTTLGDGLRVATDPMDGVETVSLGIWVGVGTRNESAEVNGVAHLVEHMLFKGTRRRSAFDISAEIEAVGGHLNAYTTREHTAYYAKVLKDDVPLALDILADMVQHAQIDGEELTRERAVVLQEIGQAADTPDDIIFDLFQETAYPGQALGRPVLGLPDIVGKLPRQALVDYIGGHYAAPSMVLAAAGRIEHDRLVELASASFRDLPAPAPMATDPARYQGGERREERDLEQVHVVLGFESVDIHAEDYYAHAVYSTLLGGGMSSRLFQEVREKRGLVYSVHSFQSPYADGGIIGIYAGTGPEEVAELMPVTCDVVAGVPDSLTDEEVARARAQIRAGILMSLESTTSRTEQLGQQLLVFGRPLPPAEILSKLEAVDTEAVRRAARRVLSSRPTLVALGPIDHLESYDSIVGRLG